MDGVAFFENQVRPLLLDACVECHGPGKQESGLRLDSPQMILTGGDSGAPIVPHRPDESLLMQAVRYEGDIEMPPAGRLAEGQLQILRRWIEMGAPVPNQKPGTAPIRSGLVTDEDRSYWAFQPLQRVQPPKVSEPYRAQSPIDFFILRRLDTAGITPVMPASRRELIRRVSFDLTGLPPTPADIVAFEGDKSPQAFHRVVDRLLASPAYGERWGRHWLDVVRYADTAGETADYPLPEAYRYRNYVIDAFNHDKPYDQFIREQIAGDILARHGPPQRYAEQAIATGLIALSRRFGYDSEQYHHMTIQDTIDTVGQAVMGLSLGCARCHPHKFDPITTEDYYSLFGIFASTRYPFPGSEEKKRYRSYLPLVPAEKAEKLRLDFERRVGELENELRTLGDGVGRPFALGSIDDIDGDFQLQQLARGGSYGIPVDPWWFEGPVSIESSSQSPYSHAFRKGTLGVHLAAGSETTSLWQSFEPPPSEGTEELHFAFDFRLSSKRDASGEYQVSLGRALQSLPALALTIGNVQDGRFRLRISGEANSDIPADLFVDRWYHVSLRWNVKDRTYAGLVSSVSEGVLQTYPLSTQRLRQDWDGVVDSFLVQGESDGGRPALDLDNLIVRRTPVPELRVARAAGSEAAPNNKPGDAERQQQRARILDDLAKLIDAGPYPQAYGVSEGYAHDEQIQKRGDPLRPGDTVRRRWLEALTIDSTRVEQGSGRLELANWLTKNNPLTARVIANRIWQYHFGHGLVRTENDFGRRGELPTHPHLLDFLAARLVKDGWSIKRLHKLILLSSTYQRSSRFDSHAGARDPLERLYWRFPKRRLDAESIRDAILMVSGSLDQSPGERHPFPSAAKKEYSQHGPFRAVYPTNRRSVYLMVQRTKRHPFLSLFDGPDPNASTAKRKSTTVPTQALFFMNDPFVHEQSELLGRRLLARPTSDQERIQHTFWLCLGRPPNSEEVRQAMAFLKHYQRSLTATAESPAVRREQTFAAFARTMFSRNEFLYVD